MAFCGNCGTNVSGTFCTNCGTLAADLPVATKPLPPPAPPRAEQTLFDEAGIFISSSRFISNGQTYAMSGVTSVGTAVEQPSRMGPILLMLVGVFFALIGLIAITKGGIIVLLFGAGLIALGAWMFNKRVPIYTVLLRSASGEQRATFSTAQDLIARIIAALNEAIVIRG